VVSLKFVCEEADPPLPHPSDEDLSLGTLVAKDDNKKAKTGPSLAKACPSLLLLSFGTAV
jgi:hypothetical protein